MPAHSRHSRTISGAASTFSTGTIRPAQPYASTELKIHPVGAPGRAAIETFIQQRYAQRYAAHVQEWPPFLASLELDGETVAAAGYRGASERLYLERYLPAPIEACLTQPLAGPPSRLRIVEAGTFAATQSGAGRLLVPLLATHLHQQGYEWAVTTVTQTLRHLFSRLGLSPQLLGDARRDQLPLEEQAGWGTYYDHAPVVLAARLDAVIGKLVRT
ncbi:thermostable hemolysin [Pigmentiphaga aceris]|uniref:Thermostable hemolysin n=1 Tax=Pigmentiphaga aceris TaxID=1940612 RepID=A0A5C0AVZ5_9BURK|nr:thermostable hemolysin [Pigmentiphaga aceris]QEI06549.1 thermostable hemolysin [Pigmentiphaga aceris]